MAQTSKRVQRSNIRVGNQFDTRFGPNPNPQTAAPHASFSSGVTLANRMVANHTSALRAVANDIRTPQATSALSAADAASMADGGIPTLPSQSESPTLPETATDPVVNNWTPVIIALAILFLVVKL